MDDARALVLELLHAERRLYRARAQAEPLALATVRAELVAAEHHLAALELRCWREVQQRCRNMHHPP
jgi:hypothetical protein